MHELSMANAIVKSILDTAEQNDATEVLNVTVEIGQMTMLNPEQIKFMVDVIIEDTIAANAKFDFVEIPIGITCNSCNFEGSIEFEGEDHYALVINCPKCKGNELSITKGRDCIVKSIKIEKRDE